MRKISIRFEGGGSSEENIFVNNFYKGLGLDPKRWLQEQEVELSEGTRFIVFGNRSPIPEELQNQQNWICRLEERDKFLLFWVSDFVWTAKVLSLFASSLNDLSSLSGLSALKSLDLRGCDSLSDLSSLSGLSALKSLDLRWCDSLSDVNPLRALEGLTSLRLRRCDALSDLSPLSGLKALTYLDLSYYRSQNYLIPLMKLKALTNLELHDCHALSDINPLIGLNSLTDLTLADCGVLADFSPLGGLTALTNLNLNNCSALSDLSPLSGLTALTSLNLRSCNKLRDLEPLSRLTTLTSLNLGTNPSLSEFSHLSGLTALSYLDLDWCQHLNDLRPLSGLHALICLNLTGCVHVRDLGPLSGLLALTGLDLGGCGFLRDLSPLSGLHALTRLNFQNCGSLSDLRPLTGLQSLTTLDLSENESIRSLSPLGNLSGLRSLKFSSRRVQSIEPLRGISSLRELSEFNPPEVAELLAHAAFRRGDRLCIQDKGNSWLEESKGWLDGSHDLQDRFAATLGECFSLLGESEVGRAYEEFLESRPDFSVAPWKAWLGGTLRESGFELYCQRVERLPVAFMLTGAIGGACATLPYDEHAEWSRKWLQELKTARLSDAKSLLSVAPEICLAHARLGEKETLGLWLVQFTDPSDSTALDPVQATLAGFQLACGDIPAAENHAFAIQSPAVRDPVLGALVTALAAADLDRASAYLLLIVDQSRKSALAKQLAAAPGASEAVLYRLLVAVGNAGFDLAEWVSAIPDPAGKRLIREFSARTQGERREILSRVAEDLRRCADEFLAEVSDDK